MFTDETYSHHFFLCPSPSALLATSLFAWRKVLDVDPEHMCVQTDKCSPVRTTLDGGPAGW